MDTNATESTPTRPVKKSRIIEISKPISTGSVPAAQHQLAKSLLPFAQATAPETSPAKAIAINARRTLLSVNIRIQVFWNFRWRHRATKMEYKIETSSHPMHL